MVDSMIKLFPAASTDFTTNGLGSLSDCLSCVVEEERNGVYELTMTYPVTGRRYNDLANRQIIFCKVHPSGEDAYQPFRIYSISKPINGQIEINAQHISYDLAGYPISPFDQRESGGTTVPVVASITDVFGPNSVFLNPDYSPCYSTIPFTFTTDKTSTIGMSTEKPYSIRTLLGGVRGSALDVYGGEYLFNKFVVKLCQNRGSDNGVIIRYGKNLIDFTQEENCAETYTAVYPYWFTDETNTEGGQDPADVPPKIVQLPEKIVEVTSVPGYEEYQYDHVRVLVYDASEHFKERPTESQLREHTKSYIKENDIGIPKISIDVSFVTLEKIGEYQTIQNLETVNLCDTVTIYFPKMNILATSKCIKTKYNVLKGRYDSITLGTPKVEISDTIAETITTVKENMTDTRSDYEKAVVKATNTITGHTGGYVILNPSTNPREILISDMLDYMNTSCHLWRWNAGGLAYSERGYNGPYTKAAITMDGQIIADFITAGVLNGSLLEAGSVRAAAISAEYTGQINSAINGSAEVIRGEFIAADGILANSISSLSEETRAGFDAQEVKNSVFKQTVDNLEIAFTNQVSGGKNLIKNSVGLNSLTSDWTAHGEVYPITSDDVALDDTVSGSEWYLSFGDLSQIVKVTKNKNYILSFKFKINTTSRCTVKLLNGDKTENVLITAIPTYNKNNTYNEDDLVMYEDSVYKALQDNITGEWDETKWSKVTVTAVQNGITEQWIEVNHAFTAFAKTVEFVAKTEGTGFYISDLSIIEGTIKQSWQPAENEIYGEYVKIDTNGINIQNINPENPDDATQTVINHREFAVKDMEGHTLLSVNPNYTWLLRTEIKHELDVGKLRIMPTTTGAELMIMDQEVE